MRASAILALAGVVFLSSYLGLGGVDFYNLPGVLNFMAEIWGHSLLADLVFTAGTAGAAILGYRLARRSLVQGIAAGAALHWLVYFASYLLIPESGSDAGLEALLFVAQWGWPGLAFAALAPAIAARRGAFVDTEPAAPAPPPAPAAKP